MRLTRRQLRSMILQEARILNESKEYSELDDGEKSYAILGFLLDFISSQPLEKKARNSHKFAQYQADLKKAGDDGRLYIVGVDGEKKLEGVHNSILKNLKPGKPAPGEISKYLELGKNTRFSN